MSILRVLIADDELVARRRLQRLLGAMSDVDVVGECADGEAVLARVRQGGVDVVVLDIEMPGLTGPDAMQLFPSPAPFVVFCTAHSDRAVQAFELGAVDYVLKPVEPLRLQRALDRARVRSLPSPVSPPPVAPPALERLPLPTRLGIVLVDPRTVSHALLQDELVTVFTEAGEYICDWSLQELETRLANHDFRRVHRRALLNLAHVARLEPLETGGFLARTHSGRGVEVSRQAARELRRWLGLQRGNSAEE